MLRPDRTGRAQTTFAICQRATKDGNYNERGSPYDRMAREAYPKEFLKERRKKTRDESNQNDKPGFQRSGRLRKNS